MTVLEGKTKGKRDENEKEIQKEKNRKERERERERERKDGTPEASSIHRGGAVDSPAADYRWPAVTSDSVGRCRGSSQERYDQLGVRFERPIVVPAKASFPTATGSYLR